MKICFHFMAFQYFFLFPRFLIFAFAHTFRWKNDKLSNEKKRDGKMMSSQFQEVITVYTNLFHFFLQFQIVIIPNWNVIEGKNVN